MADLDAQLAISADATGVETGVGRAKKSLADLGKAAGNAGEQASKGMDGVGEGAERASAKVKRAEANWVNSLQRTIAAAEAGSRSTSKYYETLAQQRGIDVGQYRPLLEQLDAVGIKQQQVAAVTAKGRTELNAYGISARQTAAAMRGVPAQLTDIMVSLQGGQAPLTVLLQQGGQLRDMFGGIVPAARALGGAVLGLLNPFTVTAAAGVALYTAFEQGRKESREFGNALVLTNNAVGLTVGQMNGLAESVANLTGRQSSAAAAIAELARQGVGGADSMGQFAAAAIRMEKATGQSVAQTAKQFAELRKAPLDALLKLNEGTNFVTEALYLQVKALQDQGRATEAAQVAMAAYSRELERVSNGVQSLGYLERAWRAVASAAGTAWDSMLDVGRQESLEGRLAKAQKLLADWENTLPGRRTTEMTAAVSQFGGEAGLRNQVAGLRELVGVQQTAAAQQADQVKRDQARIKFQQDGVRYLSQEKRLQQDLAAVEQLRAQKIISAEEARERSQQIRASYADKPRKPRDTSRQDARSQLGLDLAGIQQSAAASVDALGNAERILEAMRSAGLANETAYHAEKRRLLEETTRLQVAALEAENTRLAQQQLKGSDAIDRDRKVLENKAQIAKLEASAATQAVVMGIQETAAIQAKTAALVAARQAQQDYFNTVQQQQERELQMQGMGKQARGLQQGLNQIEDRYVSQRAELENQRALLEFEGKFTAEARAQYEARLAIINDFQARSTDSYRDYYQRLTEAQGNWALGASEALANYRADAANVFAQTESAVSSAMQGMEDALVKFVTTGKLDFTSLANSIVADITRIIIKQQISNALGLAGGSGGAMGLIGGLVGGLFGTSGTAAVASAMGGNSLDNFLALNNNFARFDGGGYTGSGPRTGGLDGKGGYLALLHPRETVVDHTKGQGLSASPRVTNISISVPMPASGRRETAMQFGVDVARQLRVAGMRNG
ncbi:phage tail tape measure protein [Macromonas nakdongensis]|uniref:phage tail tape measure protein n=1 Tax=Macromonas nakdongensis TaxID=1843082 RepID=UPI000C329837|nr:phage tail tape measure protein [Macromonas nakdongensis]